jgi:hypothetical protein
VNATANASPTRNWYVAPKGRKGGKAAAPGQQESLADRHARERAEAFARQQRAMDELNERNEQELAALDARHRFENTGESAAEPPAAPSNFPTQEESAARIRRLEAEQAQAEEEAERQRSSQVPMSE